MNGRLIADVVFYLVVLMGVFLVMRTIGIHLS